MYQILPRFNELLVVLSNQVQSKLREAPDAREGKMPQMQIVRDSVTVSSIKSIRRRSQELNLSRLEELKIGTELNIDTLWLQQDGAT